MYVESDAHRDGEDLDQLVDWAAGARDGARRRDRRRPRRPPAARGRASRSSPAIAAPGMHPDVICRGRVAARSPTGASTSSPAAPRRTTSPTSARPSREMARVSARPRAHRRHGVHGRRRRGGREAPRPLARPQLHRGRVAVVRRGRRPRRSTRCASSSTRSTSPRGSRGRAARATRPSASAALLGDRVADGRLTLDKIAIRAVKQASDGDPRRQRHAARRPGPDRLRGPLPRPAQPRLRHEPRRGRHARARAARTSRASPSSTPSPTPSREHGANTSMVFVPAPFAADAIYEAVDAGIRTVICITEGVPAHEMLRIHAYIRSRGVRDARAELPRCALAGQGERRDHPGRDLHARATSASSRARAR